MILAPGKQVSERRPGYRPKNPVPLSSATEDEGEGGEEVCFLPLPSRRPPTSGSVRTLSICRSLSRRKMNTMKTMTKAESVTQANQTNIASQGSAPAPTPPTAGQFYNLRVTRGGSETSYLVYILAMQGDWCTIVDFEVYGQPNLHASEQVRWTNSHFQFRPLQMTRSSLAARLRSRPTRSRSRPSVSRLPARPCAGTSRTPARCRPFPQPGRDTQHTPEPLALAA